jgi:uncharacterized protein (UPF0303 family)
MDRALPIVIDIRTADRTLFFAALPGSAPDNGDWARRKSNVTLRCHRASLAIGLSLKASGGTLSPEIGMDLKDYAAHGGSFPVRVKGVGVIGAITVSGLPQRQDHELITAVLAARFGLEAASVALPAEDPA